MAEIARGERFSLLALEGCGINPAAYLSTGHLTTSYCVVDRDYAHREVWSNYSRPDGTDSRRGYMRRVDALAKLDELEAWNRANTVD